MANPEHLAVLKQGTDAWNRCWQETSDTPADLNGADLRKANLSHFNLRNAHLIGATLSDANLYRADLAGAKMLSANLIGADIVESDLTGVDLRHANLSSTNITGSDLSDADLSNAVLTESYISNCDFRQSNLNRASLKAVSIDNTRMQQARLSKAKISFCNLRAVDLSEASLVHAGVSFSAFNTVLFDRANFQEVRFEWNSMADLDLSQVIGLDTVEHFGPSTIGVDTIYKSQGNIPETFLRGCGLRDWEIATAQLYDPALSTAEVTDVAYRVVNLRASQPFLYYSCFISYSTADQDFADRLYTDLHATGVRCWFAPHAIKGGRKLHEQIDEAIRLHDKLLLILSEHSMTSEWVQTELAKARQREVREGKRVLFPVRLVPFEVLRDWECFDADTGKDSAREIREYFIPDFSKWQDRRSYQQAFQKLVSDLKSDGLQRVAGA